MSVSGSGKKIVPLIATSDKLHIPLMAATLSLPPSTPQSKEVQIDNAEDDNFGNNNIAVVTTSMQMVKTLKIYKSNFFYSN